MLKLATLAAVPLALAAAPPPAPQAAGFCPTLKKIVAAGAETPLWRSARVGKKGKFVPSGFASCTINDYSGESQYWCSRDMTAATLKPAYAKLVADVAACLGTKPTVSGDDISTYTKFAIVGQPITVTATSVAQPRANSFGMGLTVSYTF